jgi:hypothetical protein
LRATSSAHAAINERAQLHDGNLRTSKVDGLETFLGHHALDAALAGAEHLGRRRVIDGHGLGRRAFERGANAAQFFEG